MNTSKRKSKQRLTLKEFNSKHSATHKLLEAYTCQVLAYGLEQNMGGRSSGAVGSASNINIRGITT